MKERDAFSTYNFRYDLRRHYSYSACETFRCDVTP